MVACGYSLAELEVASIIEAAAVGRVLVVGSLPPVGRDWDLFVHERDRATIEAELSGSGFWPIGGRWIRPSGETPDVVELVDRADWGLPADEAERLFADAMPLEGHARLCVCVCALFGVRVVTRDPRRVIFVNRPIPAKAINEYMAMRMLLMGFFAIR